MYRYILFVALLFAALSVKAQNPDLNTHRNKKDSLNMKRDSLTSKPFVPKVKPTEKVYHPDSTHSPRKAVYKSLMLPGLGQIYNRHGIWWRLPVIYAGLGLLAYNIYSNGTDYNKFLKESIWREHGRPNTDANGVVIPDYLVTLGKNTYTIPGGEPLPIYQNNVITNISDQTIYDYKDNLRRNRDLSIFGLVAVWGVNAIDAFVEAKFIHSYTMDNDLSFKIEPSFTAPPTYASNFNTTFTPSLKITFFLK